MNARPFTILVLSAVVIASIVWLIVFDRQNSTDVPIPDYKYEIRYDYLSRETDEVNILIYKRDLTTDNADHYESIGSESIYLYMVEKFPNEAKRLIPAIQFSMAEKYIEGLSSDNKFVSGKLVNPTTNEQIGRWTFNLDKKEFREITLSLPN